MDLDNNTVLITGGGSGIGLAVAERFLRAGSEVIACGRRPEKLAEAKSKHPRLITHVGDVSTAHGRELLTSWILGTFPQTNVIINNAGIQRHVRLSEVESWALTHEEIAINLEAPIHLSRLFIPHLLKTKRPAIINVTSVLSFAPKITVPIYSATKAALHSFTLSLREQLKDTPIQVLEIVPPAVDTDLGGPGLHTFGINVDVFADDVMAKIAHGAMV